MVTEALYAVVRASLLDARVCVVDEGALKEDVRFHEDVMVDDSITEICRKDLTLLGMADDETGGWPGCISALK